MTAVFSVTTPSNTQYNIERASAVAQKSLLMLIGSRLTIINANPKSPADAIASNEMLVGALMSLGESDFDKVASLVLPKIFKHGDQTPITIDSFQGDLMSYMYIVAESVRENLSDFFTWLKHQKESEPTTPKNQSKQ